MFKEHEVVTLLEDVSQGDNAAKAGEVGTIVHMYPGIDVFMVEFNHGVVYEGDLLNLDGIRLGMPKKRISSVRSANLRNELRRPEGRTISGCSIS